MGVNLQVMMTGTRLEYVVVPLEGEVTRVKRLMIAQKVGKTSKGEDRIVHTMTPKAVKEPAGFMVYFPRGHALRMRDLNELKRYKLNKQPKLINLQGLSDPNSPLGQLMMAQDDVARKGAMTSLEKQVIALVQANVRGGGDLLLRTEQIEEAA